MSPRFQPGAAVRVKSLFPPGHCRTPFYTRGHSGTVLGVADRQRIHAVIARERRDARGESGRGREDGESFQRVHYSSPTTATMSPLLIWVESTITVL